ncbi:MAG: hypothetical protein ACK5IB_09025 [Qingshengfaniella sp.]
MGLLNPPAFSAVVDDPEAIIGGIVGVDRGLAVWGNAAPISHPAETLQDPALRVTFDRVFEALSPDLVLYDLPPILVCDDVLAFQDQLDGLLLVARGGVTTAQDVREVEMLTEGKLPLVAVVMNEAEDGRAERYAEYY